MSARTERILIIDADQNARNDLIRYFETRGFYATGYPDLTSARSLFEGKLPDMVFADMPAHLIRELISRLADTDKFIPVVACTSSSSSTDVIEALRAGAADVVLKPCSNDKGALHDVIVRLLDRVRVNRLNQHYRQELEDTNQELRNGIAELRADQNAGQIGRASGRERVERRVGAVSDERRVQE